MLKDEAFVGIKDLEVRYIERYRKHPGDDVKNNPKESQPTGCLQSRYEFFKWLTHCQKLTIGHMSLHQFYGIHQQEGSSSTDAENREQEMNVHVNLSSIDSPGSKDVVMRKDVPDAALLFPVYSWIWLKHPSNGASDVPIQLIESNLLLR
ncbi:hypothetical protein BJ742DRAFT_765923 [Cladochytrium replicatum]|nr:hypothetical protein BJ742DRAFT_765923 [Cladochytrium replicatum]